MDASSSRPVTAEELLEHVGWIRHLAQNLVRDPERAADLEQETWKRALVRPAVDRSNVRGWLAAVARNVVRERARGERARAQRERDAARDEALASSAEIVAEVELERALVNHVLALDEPYRSTILLRYFRDLSPAEIAAREGVALNTVRSRIARGLERLRERLDRTQGGRETWMRALGVLPAPLAVTKTGAGALAVSTIVAALCLAIGTIAWVGVATSARQATDVTHEVALAPVGTGSSAQEANASVSGQPVDEPLGRVAATSLPASFSASKSADAGTLELTVVDAETGAPVAGLEYVVWCERRQNAQLALGRTDERGRATIAGLPEDVLLVQTERRPPHAATTRAVWLAKNETREFVMRVGGGGKVRGRVIDDLGRPRAKVQILAFAGAIATSPVAAASPKQTIVVGETDGGGRFEVDHVMSRPRAVWVVEGEERPERWDPVTLYAADPAWVGFGPYEPLGKAQVSLHVGEGATVEVVVVLPRDATIAGTVRFADGEPAAGVLVTPRVGLSLLARSEGFAGFSSADELEPLARDALTGPDGSFVIDVPLVHRVVSPVEIVVHTPTTSTLFVATRGGASKIAQIQGVAPAKRVEGVVIELPYRAPFELALEFEGGEPGRTWFRLFHRLLDGSIRKEILWLDRDSVLRPDPDPSWKDVRSLDIEHDGFEIAHLDLPDGLVEGERHAVTMHGLPRIVVAARWKQVDEPILEFSGTLGFRACVATREERLAAGMEDMGCCGLGDMKAIGSHEVGASIALAVRTRRPYWIHVSGSSSTQRLATRSFGPFVASDERHDVELDPRDVALLPEGQAAKEPPPKSTPGGRVAASALSSMSSIGYVETSRTAKPERFRVRFLEPSGAPATGLALESPGWRSELVDGVAELRLELPETFVVSVRHTTSTSREPGFQAFRVDEWGPDAILEFTLRPWRTVEIDVDGFDEATRFVAIGIGVQQLDLGTDAIALAHPKEVASDDAGVRRFALRLAPGRYRASVTSLAFDAPPIEFTVAEGTETQCVAISAR